MSVPDPAGFDKHVSPLRLVETSSAVQRQLSSAEFVQYLLSEPGHEIVIVEAISAVVGLLCVKHVR